MLGLLYKDILYIKKMWRTLLIFVLFSMGFSLVRMDVFVGMSMLSMLIGGSLSMTPFTYDNYTKWSEYQYAFPISKKTAVYSRYLFGLLLFVICMILNIIVMVVIATVSMKAEMIEILPVFFIPILQSISFPLMYHFGAEKGRIYVICAVAGVISITTFFVAIMKDSTLLHMYFDITYYTMFTIITITVAVIYILSMFLSIHIEQKKIERSN